MNVYTDGSCSDNGQPNARAGIGIWFGENDERNVSLELKGKNLTNNIAELTAILYVFRILKKEIKNNENINIYSDSKYSIDSLTKWAPSWNKNNWKKKDNTEIKNLELIKKLYKYFVKYKNIKLHHVKAHTNFEDDHSIGNDHADTLAGEAIDIKKIKINVKNNKIKNKYKSNTIKIKNDNNDNYVFTFGKYKGRDFNWVKENDEGYIDWCINHLKNKEIVSILNNLLIGE